jgi:hypothetical protein
MFDLPEQWFGKSIERNRGFPQPAHPGKHRVHVTKFNEAGKILDGTVNSRWQITA